MKLVRWTLACTAILTLSGCGSWHYTVNAPLERHDASPDFRRLLDSLR